MTEALVLTVARKSDVTADEAKRVVEEFLLELHRRLYEYKGLNGDYIGEELHYELSRQGFYHLLGLLEVFAERYSWERGTASEYLLRLAERAEWSPYRHQTESWRNGRSGPADTDGE